MGDDKKYFGVVCTATTCEIRPDSTILILITKQAGFALFDQSEYVDKTEKKNFAR